MESFQEITLRALVVARWVMIAIMALLGLVFGGWVPGLDTPALQLLGGPIDALGWYALVCLGTAANFTAQRSITWLADYPASAGLQLVGDALILSAFLALSGGAANPFTILYFVPIMLATQVSPRWTWGIGAVCLACFGMLFLIGRGGEAHGHHFSAHLKGMWLAFAVSGGLITFSVHRIAVAIVEGRREIDTLREAALRDRQLARLGSLAAGAAHELGTPLATMAILVGDLDSMTADERRDAIASIKVELARCKAIIGSMANSELKADDLSSIVPWQLSELRTLLTNDTGADFQIVDDGDDLPAVAAPQTAVVQIIRELISNADASGGNPNIRLRMAATSGDVHLTVEDDGLGMSEDIVQMARDPFFTTREDTGHLGLGLFLAETQARQLGGSLAVTSKAGVGTRVSLILPAAASLP